MKVKLDAQKQKIPNQQTNKAKAIMDTQKRKIAAQKAKLKAKLGETGAKIKDKSTKGMRAAMEFNEKWSEKLAHKNMGRKDDWLCPYCKRPLDHERPIGGGQPFDDEPPFEYE